MAIGCTRNRNIVFKSFIPILYMSIPKVVLVYRTPCKKKISVRHQSKVMTTYIFNCIILWGFADSPYGVMS